MKWHHFYEPLCWVLFGKKNIYMNQQLFQIVCGGQNDALVSQDQPPQPAIASSIAMAESKVMTSGWSDDKSRLFGHQLWLS